MKKTQSVTMLVTLMILSSGFNNVFAKNIQSGKAYVCTSAADCKKKCEDDGNTWKPDTSGTTHGTCTKKKSNSTTLKGKMTNKALAAPLVMPTKETNAGSAISQPNMKPMNAPTVPAKQQITTPEKYIGETEKGKVSPSASSLLPRNKPTNKPTTGIKTAPAIKNISKTPVRLPKGNVKTLRPALVSPTPPAIPVPYPNTSQKGNLQQAPTGKRSGGFVPPSKVPGALVAPGLQNNNSNTNVASAPGDATNKPVSLSVTFDSVVATAIVVIDDNQKSFTMDWGDGESKSVNLNTATLAGSNNAIGPNTYRFQHIYKQPFQGSYLIHAVGTDAQGYKASDAISYTDINPRYQLSFYSIILKFPDHLDSIFEENSEVKAKFIVKQGEQTLIDKTWEKNVRTGGSRIAIENEPGGRAIFASWRIEESIFSREVLYFDDPINIELKLSETDYSDGGILESIITAPGRALQKLWTSFPVKFDGRNTGQMPFSIQPNGNSNSFSGSHSVIYGIGTNEGEIIAEFTYDLKLIVPIDSENTMMLTQ